nr:hypothetical protein [uncultured bacterium]
MNDDEPNLYVLKLQAIFRFMDSLRAHRLRATAVLAMVMISSLVVRLLDVPGGWMERLAWWLSVACGALCLTVIVGATLLLWRLAKERDRVMRGGN